VGWVMPLKRQATKAFGAVVVASAAVSNGCSTCSRLKHLDELINPWLARQQCAGEAVGVGVNFFAEILHLRERRPANQGGDVLVVFVAWFGLAMAIIENGW
jgi:hypothetical protein